MKPFRASTRMVHRLTQQGGPDPRGVVGPIDANGINAMISGVNDRGQSQLPNVAQALGSLRLGFRFAQCRQKQPCQNCDDGDDDQEFNQGETNGSKAEISRTVRGLCFQGGHT